MAIAYTLKVLRAEGLRLKHRLHSKIPDPYVEVSLGGDTRETKVIKDSTSPTWNEHLAFFSSDDSAKLEISVKHKSSWLSHPSIGSTGIKLSELLARCANGETCLSLLSTGDAPKAAGLLYLHLELSDAVSNVERSLETAVASVQERGFKRSASLADTARSASDSVAQMSKQGDLYCAVRDLLSRLDVLRGVLDAVSEIHPFLTLAWSLVSGLYKAVDHTFHTDKKLVQLVYSMEDAFAFVQERNTLRDKVESLQQSIEGLLKQTAECCMFVRRYAQLGFLRRMLDIGTMAKVDEFEAALSQFKDQIDSGTILHTAVVSSRVLQGIGEILDNQRLSVLRELLVPASFEAFNRPSCLPETRVGIREQIIEWAFSDTDQNIFWLHGVAGSGKSTVCTTVASKLRDMSRLGAFLFFERGKSDPSSVIRTIAYKLALFDPSIGSSILSEIENDKDILTASSSEQFTKLLLRPLDAAAKLASGPIAIALDAIDECGTPQARRILMDLFRRDFPRLPKFVRVLITSRREPDIDKCLSSLPETVRVVELDSTTPSSHHDVRTYLSTEMDKAVNFVEVPENWILEEKIKLLGKAANGLFIWASTAVKTVRDSSDPFYQLNLLVENSSSLSGFGLDDLYASVLRNSGINWMDERLKDRFRKILALVLFSKIPLSIKMIDDILGWKSHESSRLVLSNLRSLVAYTEGGTVSLFHTSFSDYLLSEERTKDSWFIDIPAAKHQIVERCFSIMADLLRFNICDLESSFFRNDDVQGLTDRITERIPPHLEYACLYWAQHLLDVPHSPVVQDMLSDFARHRLLFWFEALSLIKAFYRTASRALLDAAMWSETYSPNMAAFLRDASNLASTYAPAISQSTPHIYISMIPLSKHDSLVAQHYLDQVTAMVQVERRGVKRPPMHLKVFDGHSDIVYSVAFSPNGGRVASACQDGSIRIWDIASGEEICAPLTGHSGSVSSVCFSPDGRRIVSGSWDCTIRVWDAETGELILGPLSGHEDAVRSVVFSPDGSMIASASGDKTIVLWDAEKGERIASPLTGHNGVVRSVAFSPDGARLVSGSDDRTIIIWDVESGRPLYEPLQGHSDLVYSVAFSPDGKHIVSGSGDSKIIIWDAESGRVISTLSDHSLQVFSIAYSPCGTCIASGSADNTIMIWDAETGQVISGPFKGHSSPVSSVAWSRCGKYIASGSHDRTVRIWDATARVDDSERFSGHTAAVMSVVISPHASRIASASVDNSIIVWDAENGELVLGPLLGDDNCANRVVFSLDGSQLISGSGDGTIRVWNAENGATTLDPLKGHTDEVFCITLSPDGSKLASGSSDNTIRIWSLPTGKPIAGPLQGHSGSVWSVSFSPDGKLLVSGSDDKTIRIWDTDTWECVSEPLTGHTDTVSSVCFSPDGTRITSGSYDRTIIIWDVQTQQMIGNPLKGHMNVIMSVIFSLDGKYVISGSGDNTIRIWHVDSRSNIEILEGHTSFVMSLALSPDGSRLVSGSFDNTIRTWAVSYLLQTPDENDVSLTVDSPHRSEYLSEWVLDGGWILPGRGRGELVLWIPSDLRTTLWRPQNIGIFSCEFSTRLDFEGAALGERWAECFTTREIGQ